MLGRCPGAGQAPGPGTGPCRETPGLCRVQPQGWERAQGQPVLVASPRRPRRPQGSLLRGQLRLFLQAFFQKSEPAVVRVLHTMSDVLQRLGPDGVGAQSLGVARNARSFFDDVSAPRAGPRSAEARVGRRRPGRALHVRTRRWARREGGRQVALGPPRVPSPTPRGPRLPQGLSVDQDWFPFPGKLGMSPAPTAHGTLRSLRLAQKPCLKGCPGPALDAPSLGERVLLRELSPIPTVGGGRYPPRRYGCGSEPLPCRRATGSGLQPWHCLGTWWQRWQAGSQVASGPKCTRAWCLCFCT